MQIYNEDINDLLAPQNTKLQVHEHPQSGVHVSGLREDIVSSPEQVLQLLEEGESHRHVGETKMNKSSSRSHTIFRMVIESRSTAPVDCDVGAVRVSTLTLVDLAGSERIAKTRAEGQRAKEGAAINKSLLTLGTVINKLSEGANGRHIPYRDSKLTRILQPSLGGNAKTAIICAITPAVPHIEESHSTLRFACRAKRVVNNATVNEVLSDDAVLKRQAKEIEILRKALQSSGREGDQIDEEISRLRAELLRKDQENDFMSCALAAEKEEKEKAQRKVESITRIMLENSIGTNEDYEDLSNRPRRENRRETWCPGSFPKRPSLTKLVHVTEDRNLSNPEKVFSTQRRSEGACLVQRDIDDSRPRKIQRQSVNEDTKDFVGIPPNSDMMPELQSRIRELEAVNELMQKEIDSITESANLTQKQLQNAEKELVTVSEERDRLLPKLKETEWRNRQTEKSLTEITAERDMVWCQLEEIQTAINKKNGDEGAIVSENVGEMKTEIERLRKELKALVSVKAELAEARVQQKNFIEKVNNSKETISNLEDKLASSVSEVASEKRERSEIEEKLKDIEVRNRSLFEENERLNAHISDLEKRKRAPLYQKRQEAELQAALDRAKEAEVRALETDMQAKELRVQLESLQKDLASAKDELERHKREEEERLFDIQTKNEASLKRVTTEAELASARYQEELQAYITREEGVRQQKSEIEQSLREKASQLGKLQEAYDEIKTNEISLQNQIDELQACADAATEHIKFIEDKAEMELQTMEDEKTSIQNELQKLREHVEKAAKEHTIAVQSFNEEREALMGVNNALENAKKELEGKLSSVAGALKAADDLKELRRKHKDEVMRLNQALKAANIDSKGNVKAVDRASKEAERLKQQIAELEKKYQTVLSEKSSVQLEKAAGDRELRQTKDKLEKMCKSMDRMEAAEQKRREPIIAELKQARNKIEEMKTDLDNAILNLDEVSRQSAKHQEDVISLQEQLKEVQGQLTNTTDENTNLKLDIETAHNEIEELKRCLQETQENLSSSKDSLELMKVALEKSDEEKAHLQNQITDLSTENSKLEERGQELNVELTTVKEQLFKAETRFAEIEQLNKSLDNQVQSVLNESNEIKNNYDSLSAKFDAVKHKLELQNSDLEKEIKIKENAVAEKATALKELQKENEEKTSYISSLETQLNEAMSESMEAQATIQSTKHLCSELENMLLEAKNKVNEYSERAKKTEEELDLACQRAKQAQTDAMQMESKFNENKSALMQMEENIGALVLDLSKKDSTIDVLKTKVLSLEKGIQIAQLDEETKSKQLQEELGNALQQVEKWKASAEEYRKDLENLEQKSADILQIQQKEMQLLQENLKQSEISLKEKTLQLEEVQNLRTNMALKELELKSAKSESLEISLALTKLRNEHDQLKCCNDKAENELSELKQLYTETCKEYERKVGQLEDELHMFSSTNTSRDQEKTDTKQVKNENNSDIENLILRCKDLESQLRKSKRREEKLQALQFRLRQDLEQSNGDLSAFDRLVNARALEYELDRALNRASKEKENFMKAIAVAEQRAQKAEAILGNNSSHPEKQLPKAFPLENKENIFG